MGSSTPAGRRHLATRRLRGARFRRTVLRGLLDRRPGPVLAIEMPGQGECPACEFTLPPGESDV